MTLLCWFGIRTTVRTNQILLAFMSLVMAVFLCEAIWYIFVHANQHWQGPISTQPLYAIPEPSVSGRSRPARLWQQPRTSGATICFPRNLRPFEPRARQSFVQRRDCRRTRLHRKPDGELGESNRGPKLRSTVRIHGRQCSCAPPLRFLPGTRRETEPKCRT